MTSMITLARYASRRFVVVAVALSLGTGFWVGVAASQPPAPGRGNKTGQEGAASAQQNQQNPSIEPLGTDAHPLVVRTNPSAAEARENQKDRLDQKYNRWANIGVGICTLAILVVQGILFKRQNDIMVTQNTILISSQRAWLNIASFVFGPNSKTGVPTIWLEISNSGRQPGTITDHACLLFMDNEKPQADVNSVNWDWEKHSAVATPDRNVVVVVPFPGAKFTKEHWRKVLSGDLPISIYGVIRYETGFPEIKGETGYGFTYDHADTGRKDTERFSIANTRGYNYAK
jgi:hypothetical protein